MSMTREEAQAEAKRRWGPDAIATHNFQLTYNCEVASGTLHPPLHYGVGETFNAAFADADRRDAQQSGEARQ